MIISDITPLNTKKSKIIFLDGDSIALYNGEIRRMDITVGREISYNSLPYTKKESICKTFAYIGKVI